MILLGVDVGQATDPSAVVALGRQHGQWHTLAADNRPLGESYEQLAETVHARACEVEATGRRVLPVVDRTGVGRPVVERLTARRDTLGVSITAGKRHGGQWPHWTVPKRLLLHVAELALGHAEAAVPSRRQHPALAEQLAALTRKSNGRVEARGAGHDDLALAWMLALYAGQTLAHPERTHRWEIDHGAIRPR